MSPVNQDIDINRRNFIKTSFILAGAFVFGKISEMLPTSAIPASGMCTSSTDTKEYRNARYGFSFLHPSNLAVRTFDEKDGATTITFQNVEKARGFQIFIVPYSESRVTDERFRQDAPLGVRKSPAPIVVDGVSGDAFYGIDAIFGATREIWLVRGGFLYEVTTLASLDAELDAVIKTWKFV